MSNTSDAANRPATLTDLIDAIPVGPEGPDPDEAFATFIDWVGTRGITPYPHQEEALLELAVGSNVILATPTGSGKSLVAMGAHFFALADFERTGRRTYYTAPIKALVSEKFFDLVATFGARNVGMLTGDAAVNASAPIVCCTAEVLANIALREGEDAAVGQVVMDEFHFYSEPDRGWAWQVPILTLPQAQFLLMSATLGDTAMFVEDLTARTGRETTLVAGAERPIPLSFEYAMTPLHETLEELVTTHQTPVYVVHFTQAAALERAQSLMSLNVATKEEKQLILNELRGFRFAKGFGAILSRLVKHGIGVHHAGMLPKYRRLVETLAQKGLLKVICGTDTLGVGINVPIRTVVFTGLTKFDGSKQRLLKSREFHQIAGRAGRAGFDTSGTVVVQAPDHVIENHKALLKAGDDEKKRRKVQRKKPPEGFVNWSEDTFARIRDAEPEAMVSRMQVSHAMILNMIQRPGDAVAGVRRLLTENHEPRARQTRLQKQAIEILRTLLDTGVVERLPEPDETGRTLRIVEDLQRGFALNQPLSPFALAALDLLDPESPLFALDVVSIIEATLDDPRPILMAQQFAARGEAVAEMKADGIEYEERMELLEDVTWPKPLEELLEAAFTTYRQTHPWLDEGMLSPKSVVRDLYERAMTFGEYVAFYNLARAEGVVLRYLSDAYKALRQTVPDAIKTEEVDDLIEWLGEVVRQTDSSLLDEWEVLTDPDRLDLDIEEVRAKASQTRPLTGNPRALRVLIRNVLWQRVELAARNRVEQLGALDAPVSPGAPGMDADDWADALDEYYEEHDEIGTGPDARGPSMFVVDTQSEPGWWLVQQIIDDPAGDHDWRIWAEVDLEKSDETGELVMRVVDMGRMD